VFSSSNGVDAVEERLRRRGRCLAHRPRTLRVAAVGRKTAARLDDLGAAADFVPPAFVADSLVEHFPVSGWGLRLLLPRVQSGGRTLLADAFAAAGARVVEVPAYETRCPTSLPTAALAALDQGRLDAITFSSGKTVLHTAQLLEAAFGDDWTSRLSGLHHGVAGAPVQSSAVIDCLPWRRVRRPRSTSMAATVQPAGSRASRPEPGQAPRGPGQMGPV
jgi:uroporphyrinogen-III synthase